MRINPKYRDQKCIFIFCILYIQCVNYHYSFLKSHIRYHMTWIHLVCVWLQIKKPVYFTIQLIFTIIHGFHYTFWYYSWVPLYYFSYILPLSIVLSPKNFQFQQNKRIPKQTLKTNGMENFILHEEVLSSVFIWISFTLVSILRVAALATCKYECQDHSVTSVQVWIC